MTPLSVLGLVTQVLGLIPQVTPAVENAINSIKDLFEGGKNPTQADIDALIDKIKNQSATIQSL